MDERRPRIAEKPPTAAFRLLLTVTTEEGHRARVPTLTGSMAHWAGSNLTNGTSTQLGRALRGGSCVRGGAALGAGTGFPAGDGLDGLAAVSRHQVDDPVHVTRLEQVHHLLVIMARLVDIYKAGKSIRSGNIP